MITSVIPPLRLIVDPDHGACVVDSQDTPVVVIEKVEGWVRRAELVYWTLVGTVIAAPAPYDPGPVRSRFEGLELG